MINLEQSPPKMPKRETRALIDELKEIRAAATFERACFFGFDPDKDAELKDRTDLFRRTWIILPLDALIERYETALAE